MIEDVTLRTRSDRPDPAENQRSPLILDVDNVLIRADLLWESAVAFVRSAPWRVFLVLAWLLRGRATLKAKLACESCLDLSALPINNELVAIAVAEHEKGRPIHLATAADGRIARDLAQRFAFVDLIFASDGETNLKGETKARRLQEAFPGGFDYVGDSAADLAVWRAAREIAVVNASPATLRRARRIRAPVIVLPRPSRFSAALKLLRPHQWVKNALLFVPLMLGGNVANVVTDLRVALTFVALSLIASGTYVLNDLLDLEDDRRHWSKCKRPLASGCLPLPHGMALGVVAMIGGIGLGSLAGTGVLIGLLAYLAVSLSYSLKLKRVPLVDVLVIAALFTLRLAIGATAATVAFSPWLLTFSMFLFLSLALAKRHTELTRAVWSGRQDTGGRGYLTRDEPMVLALGIGALVAGIVVFVLYLTQEAFVATHLAQPRLLWCFPPGLFLIAARIWLVSGRGELDDDPVTFAIKDKSSLMILAGLILAVAGAWIGLPH